MGKNTGDILNISRKIITYNSELIHEKKEKLRKLKRYYIFRATIILNREILEAVLLESGIRQGSLVSPFPFNIAQEVLKNKVREFQPQQSL